MCFLSQMIIIASLLCSLQDHRDDVNCLVLSDRFLASCSGDKTVRVYSCEDFRELRFSPLRAHAYGVHCCCFSSCGRYLASCSTDARTILGARARAQPWPRWSTRRALPFESARSPLTRALCCPARATGLWRSGM